jgi:hypothetical protein
VFSHKSHKFKSKRDKIFIPLPTQKKTVLIKLIKFISTVSFLDSVKQHLPNKSFLDSVKQHLPNNCAKVLPMNMVWLHPPELQCSLAKWAYRCGNPPSLVDDAVTVDVSIIQYRGHEMLNESHPQSYQR